MTKRLKVPLFIVIAALLAIGAKCGTLPMDHSVAAAPSNDQSIIFQGDNAVSQKGYLFIQKREGTPLLDRLSLIVPVTHCSKEMSSCARFQFFRKDGSPGVGGGIPKGEKSATILLSEIVGHTGNVTANDDGEYSAIIQFYYLGNDLENYSAVQNGFIRLNVLSADYAPIGCQDPAIAWRVQTAPPPNPCEAQFTTAGRAVACGKGCKK